MFAAACVSIARAVLCQNAGRQSGKATVLEIAVDGAHRFSRSAPLNDKFLGSRVCAETILPVTCAAFRIRLREKKFFY